MTLESTQSSGASNPTVTTSVAAPEGLNDARSPDKRRSRLSLHRLSVVVLIVGLVVTGALTAGSRVAYLHDEQRLSNLQTNLTASALGIAPVDLERRLGQVAAASAEAADPVATFRQSIAPSMAPAGPFATASLVLVRNNQVQVLAHAGAKAIINSSGKRATALFRRAAKSSSLVTTRVTNSSLQRFGYLVSFSGSNGTFVASAGQDLPSSRRLMIPANSPDAGLNIAIYFGRHATPAALIESNVAHPPLTGTVSSATVPFGSSYITLVMSPRSPLTGRWSQLLPWGILIFGVLFTLGLVAMTERLVRRRKYAEQLADENRNLYAEQRNVALALQKSLLPKALPSIDGMEFAARYIPGDHGVEVGGDWYSAIVVDDHRFAFVVGDVSGRGVAAASIMASLRYTIRAYASLGYNPSQVLTMASREINIRRDGHFATVLVGLVDNQRLEMTLASAGHLPALLSNGEHSTYIEVPVGTPLGISAPKYDSVTVAISQGSTVIAFTDGLVERRNESLDAGLERLRHKAQSVGSIGVEDLLSTVADALCDEAGADDDTAILAFRWLE
jgi:serine phosphatase RsbU (regulator of sigma subunit)